MPYAEKNFIKKTKPNKRNSFKAMGGSRGTTESAELEPESSKNSENRSPDADGTEQILRSVADDAHKNRNITEGYITSSISDEDQLKICRTISVKLIRLPEALVNKCMVLSDVKAKKKRSQYTWKHGFVDKHKRQKYLRQKRSRALLEKSILMKSLKFDGDQEDPNDAEKLGPDEIVNGEIPNKFESTTNEELPSDTFELSIESTEGNENEIHKCVEFTEICETTVEECDTSESPASESIEPTETYAESQHQPDERNFTEIPRQIDTCLVTKICQDSANATINPTKISSQSSLVVSPEQNNNQNRKICSRRLPEPTSSITIEPVETRKRLLQYDDDETEETQRHLLKKLKSVDSVNTFEGEAIEEGRNTSESSESTAPIAREITLSEINQCDPKSVRRRTKPTGKNILREASVCLFRLEDSQDPLVLNWKLKTTLELLSDITVTACTTSPINNHLDFEVYSEPGAVVAGVPITSLEDPLETLDANKIPNRPQDTSTDSLSKEDTSYLSRGEENTTLTDSDETESSEEDEDDEEIVRFLRTRRKVRPSVYSSSSASSSSCQEITSPRLLRSNTLSVNSSSVEKISYCNETSETPALRSRIRLISTNSSSSEDTRNHKEIPKTSPRRHEEAIKTPVLLKRINRKPANRLTSDSECSREELRKPPLNRRKPFRVVMKKSDFESTLNNSKCLNSYFSKDEASVSALTHARYSREEVSNQNEDDAGIMNECANRSVARTSNFVTCGHDQEDDVSLEALAEVNCDFSAIDTERSNNCDEVLMARRKLTAMKNAMVVLTRLEDLDSLSEDNRYLGSEIEFRTAEDFEFSRNLSPTPDPLEIRDDNQNPLCETENSVVRFFTGATRVTLKKPLRKDIIANTFNEVAISETPESDVEMTLVLEENSSQETFESDAESLIVRDANGTLPTTRDQSESPDIVVLDVRKSLESQNNEVVNLSQAPSIVSVRSLAEGIPAGANINDDDSGNAKVHDDEDHDKHCKRCPRDEHGIIKRRVKCQYIPVTHMCITCRSIFKNAELLQEHKNSSNSCHFGFLCNACQATFETVEDLTNHQVSCGKQGSQTQSSVDESTNEEETSDSQNPSRTTAVKSPTKANQRKQQIQNNISKKTRSKNRARVDNLVCGVCSINFATTQALSEHIFKHNTEELQEAYRIAKAKALEDSQTSNVALGRENDKTTAKQMAKKNASNEANKDKNLLQDFSAETVQPSASSASVVNNDTLVAKSATVCSCHRDKNPARPDKTDLQIEMVLLCQYCSVMFRRRECFETHYRTSPQCANDRTRGRWPRLYCANCQSTLNSWAGMRRHLEVHASLNVEGTVRFVCNICRVVFVGFGALFYNHWSSHLKDSMFVASRYSFPKNSVQPIDGIPKLPIGASSDESYILVAEHVCSICKKPFSTRRDLETHEKSKSCSQVEESATNEKESESRWYCDVCDLSFTTRRSLNQHSKTKHGQRYLCVATSPTYQAFMCTRCFAMKKMVKEIEDHWTTTPEHDTPLSSNEIISSTERSRAMNEEPDDPNKSKNESQISQNLPPDTSITRIETINSSENSKTPDDSAVIDIVEDIQPEIDCVFQAVVTTPEKRAVRESNKESTTLTSTTPSVPVIKTSNSMMLRQLLGKAPMTRNSDKDQRTKIRALEDPCVNIVLSDISKANVSAKLVVNRIRNTAANETDDQPSMDSYNIVMTNKPSPGNMKMVFGRKGTTSLFEKDATLTKTSATEANDEDSTATSLAATIVSSSEPSQASKKVYPVMKNTVIRNLYATRPNITDGKKNSKSSKTSGPSQTDPLDCTTKTISALPEIIDIADEADEADEGARRPTVNVENAFKSIRVIDKQKVKIDPNNKSGISKLNKAVASMQTLKTKGSVIKVNPSSKANSLTDSGTSNHSDSFVLNTSEISFEEARLEDLTRSKQLPTEDSAVYKKPGFLRVKNLSELQAVKSHTCHSCNAAFESYASLEEHHQVHLCAPVEKDPQYPKGMSAALVLPDTPITTSTQPLPTVYAAGNVVTQQLVGLNSPLGVLSSVPVSSVIVNNETAGSWISVGSQHDPMSAVALVNTTHSLSGGTLLMNLSGQQSTNNTAGAIMTTSIATSSTTIAQTQKIFAVQQQQQQLQPSMLGINQQIRNNCSGPLGFHVLPAMVVPPSTQIDKKQCTEGALRNTSTANLPINSQINNTPFTYHSDRPNRYLCNICTTFRCNSIGTMNTHVMKHYTAYSNSTPSQNSMQSAVGSIPNTSFLGTKEGTPRNQPMRYKGTESNTTRNLIKNSWFMKNTPQGLVWVTSLTAATSQQPGSSSGLDNNQYVGPYLPHQMNSSSPIIRGGQVVYRCLVCKSAMYKAYPPLRNHVILVHGITDFISSGLQSIVQKIYLCTHCGHGTAMYDSEEGLRQHIDSCHTNTCPTCRRAFASQLSLKSHLGYCNAPSRDTQNASGNNC